MQCVYRYKSPAVKDYDCWTTVLITLLPDSSSIMVMPLSLMANDVFASIPNYGRVSINRTSSYWLRLVCLFCGTMPSFGCNKNNGQHWRLSLKSGPCQFTPDIWLERLVYALFTLAVFAIIWMTFWYVFLCLLLSKFWRQVVFCITLNKVRAISFLLIYL